MFSVKDIFSFVLICAFILGGIGKYLAYKEAEIEQMLEDDGR